MRRRPPDVPRPSTGCAGRFPVRQDLAARQPHQTARPGFGDHQLRRRRSSPGGRADDRRPPSIYDVVVVGRAVGAVGQRGRGGRLIRRGPVGQRRRTGRRVQSLLSRCQGAQGLYPHRQRWCAPPPARPTTAGPSRSPNPPYVTPFAEILPPACVLVRRHAVSAYSAHGRRHTSPTADRPSRTREHGQQRNNRCASDIERR